MLRLVGVVTGAGSLPHHLWTVPFVGPRDKQGRTERATIALCPAMEMN